MAMRPQVQSMVMADHVYVDRYTQKCVIAGTFNGFRCMTFPTVFGQSFFIYACLNDVRTESALSLLYVDLHDGKVLKRLDGVKVSGNDPFKTHELVIAVQGGVPVPHPGDYSFEVHCGDERLAYKRITAIQVEETRT